MNSSDQNVTCEFSETQEEFYQNFSWWIGGIISSSISILGVIFNTIAICILCNKKIRASLFNRLLVGLAIIDNLFLAITFLDAVTRKLIKPHSFHHLYIFVNIIYPVRSILICSSIYMTIGLSFERYIFLTRPIYHRTRHNTNTYSRLVFYIASIVTFSIVYYIPRFFDLEVKQLAYNCDNKQQLIGDELIERDRSNCSVIFYESPTQIRNDPDYIMWYINVSNLVVTVVIPGLLLGFFNYKISKSLRGSNMLRQSMVSRHSRQHSGQHETDHKRTLVLFAIVVMFVVCHALRIILNIEEVVNLAKISDEEDRLCPPLRFWAVVIIPISALLIQINACGILFIYCFCDTLCKKVLISRMRINNSINSHFMDIERSREAFKLQNFD